jgi:uncharacterized membrane protein (GlpM family)
MRILIKVLITALIIVGISELGKRFSFFAAILAALPVTSILAMIWLFQDTGDVAKVISLSNNIFWAILPSFVFFAVFPFLLKSKMQFAPALAISCVVMGISYAVYAKFVNI